LSVSQPPIALGDGWREGRRQTEEGDTKPLAAISGSACRMMVTAVGIKHRR